MWSTSHLLNLRVWVLQLTLLSCLFAGLPTVAQSIKTVSISVNGNASAHEKLAADELKTYLTKLYPATQFVVNGPASSAKRSIQLVVDGALPSEGYAVKAERNGASTKLILRGGSPVGVLYGVYALLEKAGCGFYLSYEVVPTKVNPEELFLISLTDKPLVGQRLVMDWHNFLSSCSTWDLTDWQHYIRQAVKLRFNTLMIHTYGNNPMIEFTYQDYKKPFGYLTTSNKGRDWGTQHVNDVRRMAGGSAFTDGPVFGSKAALVPDAQRQPALKALMQQVLAYAKTRGLKVALANDCDTESANPQQLIRTLPASARFRLAGRDVYLANPETPEGYAYYRKQLTDIMADYPQVDEYIVWFRAPKKFVWDYWRMMRLAELPTAWQTEYTQLQQQHPELKKDTTSVGLFAIAKLVKAHQRIARELKPDLKISTGSWQFEYMPAMHHFLPTDVSFFGLDYWIVFPTPPIKAKIAAVSSTRSIVPFVWAHHDDFTYVGRPYVPFPNIQNQLDSLRVKGLGIIHWTTRPLDIYFKNTLDQVWSGTRNQLLAQTCADMASRLFTGSDPLRRTGRTEDARRMGAYLLDWMQTAPMFGRETSDFFMDVSLKDPDKVIRDCDRRLNQLKQINPATMTEDGRQMLTYFSRHEQFVKAFFTVQHAVEKSVALKKAGDLAGAGKLVEGLQPQQVIEQYAALSTTMPITKGEEGILITLNTRWLPYVLGQQQAVSNLPARFVFRPTLHEALAQLPGKNTYFFDRSGAIWRCLGEQETGVAIEPNPASTDEQQVYGLSITKSVSLSLKTIADSLFAPGTYTVSLGLLNQATATSPGSVVSISLQGGDKTAPVTDLVDFATSSEKPHSTEFKTYKVAITNGKLSLSIVPKSGSILLNSVVIQRINAE